MGSKARRISRSTLSSFLPGFGYILSYDVVVLFVRGFSMVPFFRLDDVYVGVLASKTGIKIIHSDGFEWGR